MNIINYLKVSTKRFFVSIITLIFDFPFFYEPPMHKIKASVFRIFLGAEVDKNCFIQRGVRSTNWKNISIGEFAYIAENVNFRAQEKIYIGDYSTISPYVVFCSGGHNTSSLMPTADPIRIGKGVFIGAGAILLEGVSIGDHAIIGAGSVVTKSIPSLNIAVGNPAKIISCRKMPNEVWTIFGIKSICLGS